MSHLRGQMPSTADISHAASAENDPTLASQLRRLFHQRVDIFEPIKPNRESILFGVIKIALKAFSECARTRTFGKFGLQQIQVDCHYLHIHLWRFVSDEKYALSVLLYLNFISSNNFIKFVKLLSGKYKRCWTM